MNLIEPRVVLSVRTGDSQLAKRELVWGEPIPPFSIGTAGQWAIRAAAVDEVHLFLSFDGYRLHAAAASAAHGVSVDGVALGSDWTHVAVPSLLAFGAASIAVDCEDAGHRVTAPVRPQPIIDLSRPDRQTTQLMDLSHTLRMDTVRLEVSEQLIAEWRAAPTAEAAPQRVAAQVVEAPSLQSGDTLIFQPAPVRTLAFTRPRHLEQQPPSAELVNTLYDGGALRERATQLASAHESAASAARAASLADVPSVSLPAPRQALGALARALALFRSSSLPKQLTIALLPLAIASLWATQGGSAVASSSLAAPTARPPRSPASPVVASAPVTPLANSAAHPANAITPNAIAPNAPNAIAPNAPSDSNPVEMAAPPRDASERLAFTAAFSGNKAEAAAIYDRLAVTRNSRTFVLAARLTREDRVRKP